ncbi:hypothetical protein BBB02_05375 [Wolbachia endosymbiont of Bemisia tabaci]|nr:hypothetical protein BBB02_05375 [Wolbachia endosymbiont of Bemisia tabaci]
MSSWDIINAQSRTGIVHFSSTFFVAQYTSLYKKKEINKENLIYIDESGIEDNEFYEYGWSQRGKRLFAQGLKERG